LTLRRLIKWTLILAALFILIMTAGFAALLYPRHPLPQYEPVDEIVYLDQGWGPQRDSADRQTYYYTPQGTALKELRYDWFTALEQARSRKPFADPDHLRTFGFLVDTAPTNANPHLLPVGFTRHYDSELHEDLLDITCAACHTGQINIKANGKTIGIRVDGGEARHAFPAMDLGHFIPELVLSLGVTWLDPFTFNRFAKNVLGEQHYRSGKSKLRHDLFAVLTAFIRQGINDQGKHLYPVEEGFGRTDAIGRISNTVFADHIPQVDNYRIGDAPVSYPPLWDIWKFDWVQYGASVRHPLARNVGEGMGVGARFTFFDDYGRPLPTEQRYQASTLIDNLTIIEAALQKLTPPRWPEELLGPIDCAKATQGKALFAQRCAGCHAPREGTERLKKIEAPGKLLRDARMQRNDEAFGLDHLSDPPLPHWLIATLPAETIGTDPKAAKNFVGRHLDISPTGLTSQDLRDLLKPLLNEDLARRLSVLPKDSDSYSQALTEGQTKVARYLDQLDPRTVTIGEGLNYFGLLIRKQYRNDARFRAAAAGQTYAATEGPDDDLFFGEIDLPQQPLDYKARPLAGAWATAPYLHNGSVPNLYQLLLPASRRDKKFFVGRREFDPVHVGYVLEPLSNDGFWLDTAIAGNWNTGHEFRPGYTGSAQQGVIGPELTDPERYAIIEYLKIRQDSPDIPEFPAHCKTK
jgi:hypothetical protein